MGTIVLNPISKRFRNPVIFGLDGGGTNFRVRAYPMQNDELDKKPVFSTNLGTDKFTRIGDVIEEALLQSGKLRNYVKGMGFGIAGAYEGARVRITNRPEFEEIDLREVAETFGVPYVGGVNDLEATAYGIVAGLEKRDVYKLKEGIEKVGNQAVIAPGTGLGEAVIVEGKSPMATEGGHSDFAPIGEEQISLLRYLQEKYPDGAICYEDVLSGEGLVRIWESIIEGRDEAYKKVLYDDFGFGFWPDASFISSWAKEELQQDDPRSSYAAAMKIFVEVLAQESSNLAVKSLANGGVFIAGGIVQKNLPFLMAHSNDFREAFTWKRKQRELVKQIPVEVITKEDVNEYGAAWFVARRMLSNCA